MLAEILFQNELTEEQFLEKTISKMREMVWNAVNDDNFKVPSVSTFNDLFNYARKNFLYINDDKNPFNPNSQADEFLVSPQYFEQIKYGDCEDFSMWFAAVIKKFNRQEPVVFRVVKFAEHKPFSHVYVVAKQCGLMDDDVILDAGNDFPAFNFEPLAVQRRDYEV